MLEKPKKHMGTEILSACFSITQKATLCNAVFDKVLPIKDIVKYSRILLSSGRYFTTLYLLLIILT